MVPSTKTVCDNSLLQERSHAAPHQFLGIHPLCSRHKIIRLWALQEGQIALRIGGKVQWLESPTDNGLFTLQVPYGMTRWDYQVQWLDKSWIYDPYTFSSTFTPMDRALVAQENYLPVYQSIGQQIIEHEGVRGIRYVYVHQEAISVGIAFSQKGQQETYLPMRQLDETGVWELFLPIEREREYEYIVKTRKMQRPLVQRAIPQWSQYAFTPTPPTTAPFAWRDSAWMHQRGICSPLDRPLLIYQWDTCALPATLSLENLAMTIVPHCQQKHITHLQISSEYLFQAPLQSIAYFINQLHVCGIGIIVSVCPESWLKQVNRGQRLPSPLTSGGYFASCLFHWIEQLHLDGLALPTIEPSWYQSFQKTMAQKWPHILTIAQNASAPSSITHTTREGGWGFSLLCQGDWQKANRRYMEHMPLLNRSAFSALCATYREAFSERYILPFSLVAAKERLPAVDCFTRFRLQYSMALCHPGKLLCDKTIEAEDPELYRNLPVAHKGPLRTHHMRLRWLCFVRNIHALYRAHSPLWEIDFDKKGFAHILPPDYTNTVLGFVRHSMDASLLCVHHLGPTSIERYTIPLGKVASLKEIFCSNSECYGGDAPAQRPVRMTSSGVELFLPPYCTLIFEVQFVSKIAHNGKSLPSTFTRD